LLANLIIKTACAAEHPSEHRVVGIIGALLAVDISPLVGAGAISQGFSMGALMVSLLVALIVLAVGAVRFDSTRADEPLYS
jgi:uncharacterized membrane protein YeaQ/YmgE (transglycosylase-associated protein family)